MRKIAEVKIRQLLWKSNSFIELISTFKVTNMYQRTFIQGARRFWDKRDIDIILGTSSAAGAYLGYSTVNAAAPSDTALKINGALTGTTCLNLITWACMRVPAIKIPLALTAVSGYLAFTDCQKSRQGSVEKSNSKKTQQPSSER